MKRIQLLLMLVSLTNISLLNYSCQSDACDDIVCQNGGTCQEGICDCPTGYTGDNCETLDLTQIQSQLDAGVSPIDLYNSGASLELLYGMTYLDGLIFYLNTQDGTGLLASTEDMSTSGPWGCPEIDIPNLNNVTDGPANPETEIGARIGDGMANTEAILATCVGNDSAALRSRIAGTAWFLPSREELNLMYSNLHANGLGGFNADYYWSSTEGMFGFAWEQYFLSGSQFMDAKDNTNPNVGGVRAARSF